MQATDAVRAVFPMTTISGKFAAFGWHVIEVNGHDYDELFAAYKEAKTISGKPTCIVAKTIKGKGVSYMENQCGWHGSAPNAEQCELALKELEA